MTEIQEPERENPAEDHHGIRDPALEGDEELLDRFARTRDQGVKEELATRHLRFASDLAYRYRDRGERMDDLEQVARLGLLKAIDRYDPSRGSFRGYATPTILGELRRHFRDKSWTVHVPRDLKDAMPRIRAAIADLAGEQGRMPDTEDVAEATDLKTGEVDAAMEASRLARPTSLDAPVKRAGHAAQEGAAPLVEQVGAKDDNFGQVEFNVILEERLNVLTDRDREVLHLSFVEDLTQAEIGERIGVSQMQVSRIRRAALERLRAEPEPEPESVSGIGSSSELSTPTRRSELRRPNQRPEGDK